MADCKSLNNPTDINTKLSINMNPEENVGNMITDIPYQQAVGCLLFLAQATRPDISFAVNNVSRFNNCYTEAHWKAVKRIMRYLKSSIDHKLRYTRVTENKNLEIEGYCDADWASDIDNRRSCTGYVFKVSNAAVSWGSKRQQTIALSSTEAEYMAMSSAVQEAIWLKQLADELGCRTKRAVKLFCDNQSAIKLTESDIYRQRSKHIDIRFHYIRNIIKEGKVDVIYVNTKENVADSLTKAVTTEKFIYCCKNMGIII